jgi:hypothetical protein
VFGHHESPHRLLGHLASIAVYSTAACDAHHKFGEYIVEHVAGVDDFEVAEATYRAAVVRWPATRQHGRNQKNPGNRGKGNGVPYRCRYAHRRLARLGSARPDHGPHMGGPCRAFRTHLDRPAASDHAIGFRSGIAIGGGSRNPLPDQFEGRSRISVALPRC